jgi:drug/metabolite transporter (DMT)-like permease
MARSARAARRLPRSALRHLLASSQNRHRLPARNPLPLAKRLCGAAILRGWRRQRPQNRLLQKLRRRSLKLRWRRGPQLPNQLRPGPAPRNRRPRPAAPSRRMTDPSTGNVRFGIALAIGSAGGYGLNIVTAQIASTVGIGGALLVFYRVFLMLGCIALVLMLSRQSLKVDRGERTAMAVFGLSSSVIGTAYMSSVAFLPISIAAVLFYLFPVLIVLAEPFVEKTRAGAAQILIVCLAFAGVALVVGPGFDGLDPRGLALALLAAVGAAIQFFAAARMPKTSTVAKLFWGHLLVLPGVMAALWWIDGFRSPAVFEAAPWAVAVTLVAYVISITLQIAALSRISAAVGGLTFCAEPLFASLFAALILGERLVPWQYVGGALVLAAIVANTLLSAGKARHAAVDQPS